MAESAPVVYLLHGEDEFKISQFLSEMEGKLGDPATASMNITYLDGGSLNIEELPASANAMPFLAKRRLVVIENPLGRLKSPTDRDRFKDILEKIPASTALVLVVHRTLTTESDRKKGKTHWLVKWAQDNPEWVFIRAFLLPKGGMMARRIQEQAQQAGGAFSPQAAAGLLASLVDGDPRLADQEIQKLLAYVNYSRPVETDDVETLTVDVGQGNIFTLVDALGNRDGRKAIGMLQRLQEQQDTFSIFGMVVRQFRLLLLTREMLDHGDSKGDIMKGLRVPSFVADKLIFQARRFTLPALESIYHYLLEIDEGIKTGKMPAALALDTLVAALTDS